MKRKHNHFIKLSRDGEPFLTPRAWLVRAMHKWAKDSIEVGRKKDIEIKALKEKIKELEKRN